MNAPASYLDFYLGPLAAYLARPEVTDIYINKPCEVWIESLGGEIERYEEPSLDEPHLWRLAQQIASHAHQGISRKHPLLSASLADGSRVQVVAAPATRAGVAIAIRRHAAQKPSLQSYAETGATSERVSNGRGELEALIEARDYPAFLALAVRQRLNIVISGGTSSGKTTLLNALIDEIPSHERLVLIEDTPELRLSQPNSVGLVAVRDAQGEAQVTAEDLLQASLRMRPDRIILGELRGPEAFTFLRAINTGHPGSLTTVHADDPERAIVQLAMMTIQARHGLSFSDATVLVERMVDAVVQVKRDRERRTISRIRFCP